MLSVFFTALFLYACNSDSSVPKSTTAPVAPAEANPAAKPETYLYMVTVDNLLLRDKPTKTGSKVVSRFTAGEFVEGTGMVSDNKEEATIRNIPMKEPYFEVVSTTPEQFKGWAFSGALLRVYAGTKIGIPDLGKLSQFSTFLKTLDVKKLDSGKKAWDYVKANYSSSTGNLADAELVIMDDFMNRMSTEGEFYNMTEKIQWTEDDYGTIHENKFDMNKYPVTKSLAENGFALATGEGMVFPIVDMVKMHKFFALKVTPPMKAYLDQTLLEDQNQAWEDGGIIIPLEQVADRAVFWEKFNQENPYFPLKEQTHESQRWTKLVVINGDNNTPSYDGGTNLITEDFKKMWAYVLEKYPGTEVAKAVKEISDASAAEGWKRSPKVEALQKKVQEEQ